MTTAAQRRGGHGHTIAGNSLAEAAIVNAGRKVQRGAG
jgi:hypothetical protein